jgi:hypothetical protein
LKDLHSERRADLKRVSLCKSHARNAVQKMILGYARVSTDGQTLDAQQATLRGAGAERVFAEKVSGIVTDRKQLAKAIASRVTEVACAFSVKR